MELIVIARELPYGGRTYVRGQHFEASAEHGRLLILIDAAVEAGPEGYQRQDLMPQIASAAVAKPAEYVRRDMEPVKRKRGRPRKIREDAKN